MVSGLIHDRHSYRGEYEDKCFAVQDYSAVIENMLLAIVESCWFEGTVTDKERSGYQIAQLLGVPEQKPQQKNVKSRKKVLTKAKKKYIINVQVSVC